MARLISGFIFIALPLVELALLIKTGQVIGFWATLGMVAGAGLLGAAIISRQGLSVARRTREALEQGRPPVAPVLDGALLLLAGALLITPGFLTDVMALLLLIPPVRRAVARSAVRQLVRSAHVRVTRVASSPEGRAGPQASNLSRGDAPIIEGEFERLGEHATNSHRPKDGDRL